MGVLFMKHSMHFLEWGKERPRTSPKQKFTARLGVRSVSDLGGLASVLCLRKAERSSWWECAGFWNWNLYFYCQKWGQAIVGTSVPSLHAQVLFAALSWTPRGSSRHSSTIQADLTLQIAAFPDGRRGTVQTQPTHLFCSLLSWKGRANTFILLAQVVWWHLLPADISRTGQGGDCHISF